MKYALRRHDGNAITYLYRSGYKTKVKVDYERFLNDLMKYARVDESEIETQEDLINLFDKVKSKGINFHETDYSKNAVVRTWEKIGRIFKTKNEKENEYLSAQLKRELNKTKHNKRRIEKIKRKIITKKVGKKIIKQEEYTILFKWVA